LCLELCGATPSTHLSGVATAEWFWRNRTDSPVTVMAMTQAVLPELRERRSGVVVNVTSTVTMAPFPLVAVYTASKTAIEGFTALLALELAAVGVRVKLVEPGYGPTTRFTTNTPISPELIPEPYGRFAQQVFAEFSQRGPVTTELDVAETVYRAANDATARLHFPAGADALALARVP
jgi:NAD(P)-dependent dehydrogenase (short-subunit alcohol dehydrogenase family)